MPTQDHGKKPGAHHDPAKRPRYDTPQEVALDEANEMSFPNSDPIATSNITRINKAPEKVPAAEDHQNRNQVSKIRQGKHG